MTPYDDLLLWASEVRSGSLSGLLEAASWTAPTRQARDVVDDLVALGHVSVAEGRWTVARTSLISLANGGGNAIVVGARPRWFVEMIQGLDQASDERLAALGDHLVEDVFVDQHGPATWYLAFGPQGPLEALESVGVRLLDDASAGLLRTLEAGGPPGERRSVRPGELVAGLAMASGAELATWDPVRSDDDPGQYAYLRNNQRVYATRTSDGWFETDRRWTEWLGALDSRPLLRHVPRETALYVHPARRLPAVVEQVLVLRSGRLPDLAPVPGNQEGLLALRYANVPTTIAGPLARALNKELHYA